MMGLLLLGDYVSCYAAVLNGVDPSVTAPLVALKDRLARERSGT
jgi:hypothetical protein